MQTAKALIDTGLAGKGYKYVNLDDCWQLTRDTTGRIIADPTTFPSGIGALANYMHQRGLKLGVYSDAGNYTCQGRPGSLGFEVIDANTYASWNVDYLKYDNCFNDDISPEIRYPIMADALNKTGRPIFYSLCEWGIDQPWTWGPGISNSWRTTGDISDNWESMLSILDAQVGLQTFAGSGAWNDPDMLEVGNGGMTNDEYTSHFALWCVLKAPLIIGCDVTAISDVTLAILGNENLIAVNQDPLGIEGTRVSQLSGTGGNLEVWGGPLSGNSYVAVLFNRGTASANITVNWQDLNIIEYNKMYVFDLINNISLGTYTESFTAEVITHAVVAIKISPTN